MLPQSSRHVSYLTLQLFDVRDVDRAFPLGDAAFDLLGRIRPGMPLDHHHVLDDDLAGAPVDLDHAPLLALIPARNHLHHVVLLQPDLDRLCQYFAARRHQITSGARETIFMNFLSRSSRATGPKTRVPTGSLTSFTNTAAFESNRI